MATRSATRGAGAVAGDVTGRARAVDEAPPLGVGVNVAVRTPTLGELVTYSESMHGFACPAIVTKVWGPDAVNLQVFLDADTPMVWKTSVLYDPAGAPGTWHWR